MKVEAFTEPFRHWIIPEAVPPALAGRADLVPPADWPFWVRYANGLERKRTCNELGLLPASTSRLLHHVNTPEYVAWLAKVTGIEGLQPDPTLHGAGLHVSDPGNYLQVHADYELHPKLPGLERRLNLILFLNPSWDEQWGGTLLLTDGMGKAVRKYYPVYNRAVLFECGNASFHGVQVTAPDAPPRISIAAYYLAPARPSAHRMRAMFMPNRNGDGIPSEVAI